LEVVLKDGDIIEPIEDAIDKKAHDKKLDGKCNCYTVEILQQMLNQFYRIEQYIPGIKSNKSA